MQDDHDNRLSVDDRFRQHLFLGAQCACCRVCTCLQYVLAMLICVAAVAQQRFGIARDKPYNIIVFGTQAGLEAFLFNVCLKVEPADLLTITKILQRI